MRPTQVVTVCSCGGWPPWRTWRESWKEGSATLFLLLFCLLRWRVSLTFVLFCLLSHLREAEEHSLTRLRSYRCLRCSPVRQGQQGPMQLHPPKSTRSDSAPKSTRSKIDKILRATICSARNKQRNIFDKNRLVSVTKHSWHFVFTCATTTMARFLQVSASFGSCARVRFGPTPGVPASVGSPHPSTQEALVAAHAGLGDETRSGCAGSVSLVVFAPRLRVGQAEVPV